MFNDYVPALHDRARHLIRVSLQPKNHRQPHLRRQPRIELEADDGLVENCIGDAPSISHSVTLCNAFALGARPVALLTGELNVAERWVAILLDHAERAGLRFWQRDARCLQGILLIRRGDVAQGVHVLRAALGRVGDVPGGLAAVARALDWIERTGGRWYIAELLRIKGELILLQGAADAAAAAEDRFRQALDWACRQGALSWELRAATSFARSLRDQGRFGGASELLQPVYDRFTEGFDTANLKVAKALLDALQ